MPLSTPPQSAAPPDVETPNDEAARWRAWRIFERLVEWPTEDAIDVEGEAT